MISIGLDLSINSTGVCVYDSDSHTSIYYIIGSKFTHKALDSAKPDNLILLPCEKLQVVQGEPYEKRENTKTHNIYKIVEQVRWIINKYKPEVVGIEGISFGSTGSAALIDLSGLNYMIRMMLMEAGVHYIYIISPTQNKKYATGNGQAEKDVMISAWQKCDSTSFKIPSCIKIDDIADAYFLARYGLSLIS